jgi:hypothetical protein
MKICIKDIDLLLYKHGIIHKQDINNYFNFVKKKKFKKYKSNDLFTFSLMNTIRYIQ